jgi:hypothetical protein
MFDQMDPKEARATIKRLGKGMVMERAMESRLGAVMVEFDRRRGWETFEDDDGCTRYGSCAQCLRSELAGTMNVDPRTIRRLFAAGRAEQNLFGPEIDQDKPEVGAYDEKLKRPALPERTLRELARLNEEPVKQREAFERLMRMTNGNPTSKIASEVVDAITGDGKRKKDAKKREIVHDAQLKKRMMALYATQESNLRLLIDSDAPDWVVKPQERVLDILDEWLDLIKV